MTNFKSMSTQNRNFKIQTDFGALWSGPGDICNPLPHSYASALSWWFGYWYTGDITHTRARAYKHHTQTHTTINLMFNVILYTVVLFDAASPSSLLTFEACNTSRTTVAFTAKSRTLWIKFKTDAAHHGQGFFIPYVTYSGESTVFYTHSNVIRCL